MEYCPGVKINRVDEIDAMGLDRQRLARLAVECYLQQLLTYGFFHAGANRHHQLDTSQMHVDSLYSASSDPHPGNIAVDKQGRLVYFDFGMCVIVLHRVGSALCRACLV